MLNKLIISILVFILAFPLQLMAAVDRAAMEAILIRENRAIALPKQQQVQSRTDYTNKNFSVVDEIPATTKSTALTVTTSFDRTRKQINKRVTLAKDKGPAYVFDARLIKAGNPLKQAFTNDVYQDKHGRSWLVYDNGIDAIAYHQGINSNGEVEIKEWIYAREPNDVIGSVYDWEFEAMGRRASLTMLDEGKVGLHQDLMVNGVKADDEKERKRVIESVKLALPEAYVDESPLTGVLEPVIYWTAEGIMKKGYYQINERNQLRVVIEEPKSSYPLTIDPTFTFGTWLGSSEGNTATVRAVAIETTNDEIYAGGDTVSFFSAGAGTLAGTYTSGNEGFVAEIADGATPTVNWIQWVGAGGTDQVNSVAVNGDEVYAGGYSNSSTASWETVASTAGTYSGAEEGFVVEIADASTPTVAFRQWIGSDGNDRVLALAVTGDEIYAGGYISSSTGNFETVGSTAGTYQGASNGWVAEIADGGPPAVAWRYWVGGGGDDQVTALAVNGDEVYAGGYATSVTSFNTVGNTAGTYSAGDEGFVIEITDGSPPQVAWLQWLGAGGNDRVTSLAVTADEIYAGGYSNSTTASWETVGSTRGTYNGASEGWVVEIADGAPPTVAWQQWLGSDGNDQVLGLAVNGDEIYASGYSASSVTSWDTVGSIVGTFSGGEEAWLVEIADGAPPSVAFQHWLGGSANDEGMAVAVNADELYVGGFSVSGTSVETAGTVVGTYGNGAQMGFVVEIADGGGPSAAWLNWLGGSPGATVIQGLAINSTEIYAAGYSSANAWPGTAGVRGTQSGGQEGFVAEIADASTPSLTWVQWIGSDGTDQANGVVVNGDEIYASGYTTSSTASIDTAGSVAGTYSGGEEGWVVEIADGATPTLNWWQWIGSDGNDRMLSVAVTGDEIYGGGYIASSTANFETVGSTAGTYRGPSEGLVVEIADAGPPTVAWRYWIGAGGDDQILSVAVNGDEVYAGGYSVSSTASWSTVGSAVGTYHGASEGFVVEIADAGPPTIAWQYWVGASGNDQVWSVAVSGDEIYAGGYSQSSTPSFQTVSTFVGTYHGASEGFVVEIADGGPPSMNWAYWLGASGNDRVTSLAINGDEVYAGGYSQSSTPSWQTVSVSAGTYSGGDEGWVYEISDGSTPTLSFHQMLGGVSTDQVLALAVNSDEIFAAGSTTSASSWETSLTETYGNTTGFLLNLNDFYNVAGILYWVGGSGDSPSANANDWSTTNPSACNNGGGDAGAAPSSTVLAIFDPDCDNNATMTADWSVGGVTLSSGYSGTLATKGYEITSTSGIAVNGGTLDATDTGGEGDGSIITSGGSLDFTGGTFTAATSTVLLNGTSPYTLTSNAQSFNNLTLNDGLVGYWKLDETAADSCTGGTNDSCDSSGNGLDGAWNGNATTSTTVPTVNFTDSRSVTFDGSGDYINFGQPAKLQITGSHTIAGWVRFNSITNYTIYSNQGGAGARGFNFAIDATGHFYYELPSDANTLANKTASAALSANTWYHLTAVYNATAQTIKVYINGKEDTGSSSGTVPSSQYIPANNITIGVRSISADEYLNGYVDDFRVYNRVLSEAEIGALARGDLAGATADSSSYTLQDALDVNGNLTLNSGTLDAKSGSNYGITLAGNWTNNGAVFTPRSGTVTLDATSGTKTILSGNQAFNILTVNGTGGTWNLNQDLMISDDLNVSAGTLDFNGYDATITDNFVPSGGTTNIGIGTTSVQGSLTFTGGTVTATSGNLILNPSTSGETLTSASQNVNNVLVSSADGLVGWWKLDESSLNSCSGGEDACDSSGNGFHGTESGSVTISSMAAPTNFSNSRSISFDGTNDYITVSDPASGALDAPYFTISAWVWRNGDNGVSYTFIANKGNGTAGNDSYQFYLWNNNLAGYITNSNPVATTTDIDSGYTIPNQTWTHVAMTYDGSYMKLYANGVLRSSTAYTGGYSDSSVGFRIGAYSNAAQEYFKGNIDDVRYYNRALTSDEIAALYRGHPLSGSGTITLQDTLNVNGNVVLGDGTLALGSQSLKLAKNWTSSGSAILSGGTGTVEFNGTSGSHTISAPGMEFNILKINGTGGTWQIDSNGVSVADNLVVSAGTLNVGIGTSMVQGSLDFTGGTITPSSSTLMLNPSTGAETFTSASQSLNNVLLTSTDGLVGWWKLDETASPSVDSSTNANSGTWSGNVTGSTNVPQTNYTDSRSAYFDGVGDKIDLGSPASLDDLSTISICAWVRPNATQTQTYPVIFSKVNAAISSGWDLYFEDGSLMQLGTSFLYGPSSFVYCQSANIIPKGNKWTHVCAIQNTTNSANFKFYVNGVDVTSGATCSDNHARVSDAANTAYIGNGVAGSIDFAGYIDDLRIYNRVITPEEVQALYKGNSLSGTGTITLSDAMDVNGDIVLADGTLAAGAKTIKVAKNWTNKDASFNYGASTVDFDDDTKNNTISGNNTFYNLKIDTGTAKTVTFESGKTQTITNGGTLTLKGAVGQILTLSPGTALTNWGLTLGGTSCTDISYVTTTYSDASGGEIVDGDGTSVTAGGTNTNWCTSGCSDNCSLSALDIFFHGADF